MITAEMA
jgi:hypothetical protein